jgi:hypothetical protein
MREGYLARSFITYNFTKCYQHAQLNESMNGACSILASGDKNV